MKALWLELPDSSKVESTLVEVANETCEVVVAFHDNLVLPKGLKTKIASRQLGSDIVIIEPWNSAKAEASRKLASKTAAYARISNITDQQQAIKICAEGADYLIVRCLDWKIIPIENLISTLHGKTKIIAHTSSIEEAKVALETLELGVDGVILPANCAEELREAAKLLLAQRASLSLNHAKITVVRSIGSGARVCIDTCDLLQPGEGILVGSRSSGLFLIEAEVHPNPHVEPRPFRVNAGALSMYALIPGDKTRYLSEFKAGDEILIVDRNGRTRVSNVGRVKIERRPLLLVEAELEGQKFATIVQNAETIRLVTSKDSKSVIELKPGDEVLMHLQEGGRHFGTLVKGEMVIEA